MYDRVTPWAIDPIRRKGLVIERMAFVEVVLTQTDGAELVPPLQDHPFSTLHWESQPSPSLVFPSSHSYSYRLPSPQISGQKALIVPRMSTSSKLKPGMHSVHWFSSLHLAQYSLHFLQPDVELKNPLGQLGLEVHFPA